MIEFYAAVVRKDLDGFSADHWGREQRLTRREALEALTRGPAFAAFQEDVRGTLAPGKWADLTVLSADPLEAPEQELPQIRAQMTIVAGKVVYER